ncbi:hypothetical protein GUJ93_ZPchr0005g15601 [Zizania palustris]|uniref:Uncharacterized protein n=1 Tax=Zizania palustris TaxID=103762 RepID=A0A8J5SLV4_ZIZPA|nr:hypothetical protein GUJ93_ZPchr0005g15601 [Zizania palustris]
MFHNVNGYMQQRRNNHLASEESVLSESAVTGPAGISQLDQFTVSKFQNGRSSGLGLLNANIGVLSTGNREEAREGLLNPCPLKASAENEDQRKRPGDVKLFGQILSSHQSSLQNSGSSSHGTKSKPPSPKVDSSTGRLLSNSRDRLVYSSRSPIIAQLGLDERAMSYDHFDGRPVQPESMVMVAKCQRSSAGVPFYSPKNGRLGVLAEYQQPSMQMLPSDQKLLESFADLQKRKGIELISGFQQPGKGSRLGGAGILVNGVSDPVAALKAQYGPGSNILSNDVDTWKDIGSR